MANFVATVVLTDDHGRTVKKQLETETDVLATAQAAVGALLEDLVAVTDLGVVAVHYSNRDASEATSPVEDSNVDVGATFQGRLTTGDIAVLKIPGIKSSYVGPQGVINVEDEDIAALLANWLTAGAFTIANGKTVSTWLSGTLDK